MTLRTRAGFSAALLCVLLAAGCSKQESKPEGGGGDKGGSAKGSEKGSSKSGSDKESKSGDSGGKGSGGQTDTVTIPPEDQGKAGIQVAPVEVRTVPQTLVVAGQVQMDEKHTSHVGVLADGLITAVYVLPGAEVRRGQTLAELHSHIVHETVGALVQAYAATDRAKGGVVFAQQARDRYQHLYSIQAASLEEAQRSEQDLLQAQKMLVDAEANVHMEREHLSEILQVNPETLTPDHLYDRELVPVRSVQNGTVIARNVTQGAVMTTGQEAFVVSDLHTVWVTASVNEKDLALVRMGEGAQITSQGFPKEVFEGRVAMLGDTLDPQTRTVPVRVVVPNPGVKLRPGMFATAMIDGPRSRTAVFAPQDALQEINGMQVAFVTADGRTFQAKTVKLGTRSEGKVEIVEGLGPNDHIAVNGAFMLKGELLKGTMGEE